MKSVYSEQTTPIYLMISTQSALKQSSLADTASSHQEASWTRVCSCTFLECNHVCTLFSLSLLPCKIPLVFFSWAGLFNLPEARRQPSLSPPEAGSTSGELPGWDTSAELFCLAQGVQGYIPAWRRLATPFRATSFATQAMSENSSAAQTGAT